MKTLKLSLISLVIAGATSAVFAGPGLDYWQKKAVAAKAAPVTGCASGCCVCSAQK